MAYGKRKKGGQRLMEIARAGAKRRADRKKKTLAQARANIKKGPVTRGSTPSRGRTKVQITMKPKAPVAKAPVTKAPAAKKSDTKRSAAKKPAKTDAQKLADYRKNPTKGMAPRNLRTPAQRAALRKRLMNLKSEAKGMSDLGAGLTKDLADAEFATDAAITVATLPIGGGAIRGGAAAGKAALSGAKRAATTAGKKVKEQAAKRGLTKEGRKLRKAGNFRDTKGRIQKIDPNPFKKGGTKPKSKTKTAPKGKNPFREGGTKKPAKTSAKKSGKNPFSAKSPFNPKGEPAKKSAKKRAKKSKAIEIDIPAPKTTKRSIPKGLKAELSKLSTKKSTRKATKGATKPVNKAMPKDNKARQAKRKSLRKAATPKPKVTSKSKAKAKTKKPSVLKKGVNKAKNPQTKFKQDQLKRNMKKRGKR